METVVNTISPQFPRSSYCVFYTFEGKLLNLNSDCISCWIRSYAVYVCKHDFTFPASKGLRALSGHHGECNEKTGK